MFVLLACALVVVQCAPLHGEELIQNIENAAQNEVDQLNTKTDDLNAGAKDEEAQIESNQQFAQNMKDDVEKSTKLMDKMNSQEEQTIADAEAMAADSEQGDNNVADIEEKDADASQLSDDIQETAETVDKQLLADIDQLKEAGVGEAKAMLGESSNRPSTVASQDQKHLKSLKTKKKAAMLGESQSFKAELAAEEETAKAEVAEAKASEEQAEERKAQDDDALNQMNQMAQDGFEQLTQSESTLRRDLGGHRDSQLEQDIEAKAEEIDSLQVAPGATTAQAADEEESMSSDTVAASTRPAATFAAPTLLGENQEPMSLDDAMAQAEAQAASDEDDTSQAADDSEESMAQYDDKTAQDPDGDTDQADAVNTAIAEAEAAAAAEESAPEMEAAQESTATGTGTIDGDLKAIDQDAKDLKSYQEESLKEIAKIKEPLQ